MLLVGRCTRRTRMVKCWSWSESVRDENRLKGLQCKSILYKSIWDVWVVVDGPVASGNSIWINWGPVDQADTSWCFDDAQIAVPGRRRLSRRCVCERYIGIYVIVATSQMVIIPMSTIANKAWRQEFSKGWNEGGRSRDRSRGLHRRDRIQMTADSLARHSRAIADQKSTKQGRISTFVTLSPRNASDEDGHVLEDSRRREEQHVETRSLMRVLFEASHHARDTRS